MREKLKLPTSMEEVSEILENRINGETIGHLSVIEFYLCSEEQKERYVRRVIDIQGRNLPDWAYDWLSDSFIKDITEEYFSNKKRLPAQMMQLLTGDLLIEYLQYRVESGDKLRDYEKELLNEQQKQIYLHKEVEAGEWVEGDEFLLMDTKFKLLYIFQQGLNNISDSIVTDWYKKYKIAKNRDFQIDDILKD